LPGEGGEGVVGELGMGMEEVGSKVASSWAQDPTLMERDLRSGVGVGG
jgi:hypothetical protein